MSKCLNGGLALTGSQICSIMNINNDEANNLANRNYDPFYSYRVHITDKDVRDRIICFVWWYLEGYYFQIGDYNMGNEYTLKLCRKLDLNIAIVQNIINNQLIDY